MRNIRKLVVVALGIAVLCASPAAWAAGVSLTLRGVFSGTIDDVAFQDRALTFTSYAFDKDVTYAFGETRFGNTAVTIGDDAGTWMVTDPTSFFFNPAEGLGGITDAFGATGLLRFSYTGSDLPTAISFYTDPLTSAFATTRGSLRIDGGRDMSFATSMTALPSSPVPEPATWAMMIAGVALTGGALRRRTRATVALAA